MKVAKEKKCCLITTLTNKVAISIGPLNMYKDEMKKIYFHSKLGLNFPFVDVRKMALSKHLNVK